jgi:hypothetical protein
VCSRVGALLLAALACCVIIIRDAAQVGVSWATSYDGLDPGSCVGRNVGVLAETPLLAEGRQRIGTLKLRFSPNCSTSWGQVVLTAAAEKNTLGRFIEVTAIRPVDNRVTVSETELHGGPLGRYVFGNELGASPCVEVQARLLAGNGRPAGPLAQTACEGLPAAP